MSEQTIEPSAAPSPAQAAIDEHLALPGTPDPNHPDPDADGHVWEHVEIACASCGATIRIHRQKPEWLDAPAGVKVECSNCGNAMKLGGFTAAAPADYVLECVQCSRTFDPNTVEQAADGSWKCIGCGTDQRHIHMAEQGVGAQTGATA